MTAAIRVRESIHTYIDNDRPWTHGLLVDIGSTFTKALVVDERGNIVGQAQARTSIETDVLDGVLGALAQMPTGSGPYDWALCSSSAAGGLCMASIGLTSALSGRAGILSALGAGAKVVSTEHGMLDDDAVSRIESHSPHLVLLAGGLDGGNAGALLSNAKRLAELQTPFGYIVAGNIDAREEAAAILSADGRDVMCVDNVFPRPGEINITPTREVVRELFLRHITKAKGLDGLMNILKVEIEPTPLAVSRAIVHLGDKSGPLVFVDLGGATTDVHSLGGQRAEKRNAQIPAPEVMRTVEGDLGMRWGAPGIVDAMGVERISRVNKLLDCDIEAEARQRRDNPGFVPSSAHDSRVDNALAVAAVTIAIERHAGRVVVKHRPWGDRYQVIGKDLRKTHLLIATGGAFRHVADPVKVVNDALADIEEVQAPVAPTIAIDSNYLLYAIGLTAGVWPALAHKLSTRLFTEPTE